jgi:predicted RNA-binding Zn ribbon-like protein
VAQVPVIPGPFKLSAGDVALDFVNTLDNRFVPEGPDELLASYGDLLQFAQQSKIMSAKEAQRLTHTAKTEEALQYAVELREVLAPIFYSHVDGQLPLSRDLVRLSEYCREASAHRELRWTGSAFAWQWVELDHEPKAPAWTIAQHASDLLISEHIGLVRSCGAERCRWLFLDTSKNHTRRWCDMKTCGNRMKAHRYHVRQAHGE